MVQTQYQHVHRDDQQDVVHTVEDGRESRNALLGRKVAILARSVDHGDDGQYIDNEHRDVDDEERKRRPPPRHAGQSVDTETDER